MECTNITNSTKLSGILKINFYTDFFFFHILRLEPLSIILIGPTGILLFVYPPMNESNTHL